MSLPPIFFDIEASGLDGVPIEVGWAYADPTTGDIHTESILIRPAFDWGISFVWDKKAERLHGISIALLRERGHPPEDVARRMNAMLGGQKLFSDAPDWDGNWLQMIFAAANLEPRFSVSNIEAHTFIGNAARDQGFSPADCKTILMKVSDDHPRKHRASDDASHLAALWLAFTRGTGSHQHLG